MKLQIAQAVYPVLMSVALSCNVCSDLLAGSCSSLIGGNHFFAYSMVGTKFYPIVSYFLIRDTRVESLALSWLIGIVTLLFCAISLRSLDMCIALLSYVFASSLIVYDSHRQNADIFALVAKLQDTLAHNEELAVAAQATELRAMIGNVAHDLKTVS